MTAAVASWWNPPPAPERDLWWHAQRIAAPDVDDFATRHHRGVVRLPWDLGPDQLAGALVPAWVCCDPSCGGVELGEHVLEINHACCVPTRCCAEHAAASAPKRRHMADFGRLNATGYYHGEYTPYWQPHQAGSAR